MKSRKLVQGVLFIISFVGSFLVTTKDAKSACCSIASPNTGYCTMLNGERTCVGGGYSCNHNCW